MKRYETKPKDEMVVAAVADAGSSSVLVCALGACMWPPMDSQQAGHYGPGTDQSNWGPISALSMLLHFMPKLARSEVIITNGIQLDTAIYC